MSKLGGLISGQNVAFDTHQAGDGQSPNFEALHLEKRRHGKRGKVRFPLFGSGQPTYDGMNKKEFERIVTEVRSVLKRNPALVTELTDIMKRQMERFGSGQVTVEKCFEAARRIGEFFGLESRIIQAMAQYSGERLDVVRTLHYNPAARNIYEISQSSNMVYLNLVKL